MDASNYVSLRAVILHHTVCYISYHSITQYPLR